MPSARAVEERDGDVDPPARDPAAPPARVRAPASDDAAHDDRGDDAGAFLRCPTGIEAIPLGTFFVEIHPGLFVPAGYDVTPAVAPEVLYRALGAPGAQVLFITPDARAIAVDESSVRAARDGAPRGAAVGAARRRARSSARSKRSRSISKLEPLGLFPMGQADAPETKTT